MRFWKIAFDRNLIHPDKEIAKVKLRIVVRTEANPNGVITPEEYKIITGTEFNAE